MPVPPSDQSADPAADGARRYGFGSGPARAASESEAGGRGSVTDADRQAYRGMLLIRRFEEKAGQLYGMGFIAGFCHLCIGQEAIAIGLAAARGPADKTITAYRNHGHLIASGADITAVMAELCGRASGLSAGKAGSVNMFWPEGGFYGGHGIVGANAPIGAGLAFAQAYEGGGGVTWCILGDRAMDQGQVSEAMLLAANWSLPIVFVIENNADPADGEDTARGKPLHARGEALGIPGESVDGMDYTSVAEAATRARHYVAEGRGPCVLECVSARYRGHSMSEPGKYGAGRGPTRSNSAESDPIARLGAQLLKAGVSEDDLRAIDRSVRDEINAATQFAQADGEPSSEQLVADIRSKGRAGLTAYRRVHGEPTNTATGEGGVAG